MRYGDGRGEEWVRMRTLPGGAEKMFPTRSVIIAMVGCLAYQESISVMICESVILLRR